MLKHLSIKNFALIQDLDVEFDRGLTTITGETGAGKSIILAAVSLLTGNRADSSMVRNESKKCIIEAEFNLNGLDIKEQFAKADLEYDDHTIIRREFNRDGKSRAFINDSPAVLLHLKNIVNRLLDVHSQHENLELNNRKYQLGAVDIFADNSKLLSTYKLNYKFFKEAEERYSDLLNQSEKMRENADFIAFQLHELNDAGLSSDEQVKLEAELDTLNHAEEIKANLHQIMQVFDNSDNNVLDQLNEVSQLVKKTRSHIEKLEDVDVRLKSLIIDLEDVRRELDRFSEETTYDPERLTIIQDRLSLIYTLQQKHRVGTMTELIEVKEKLDADFEQISNIDDLIEEAKAKRDGIQEKLEGLAKELSERRKRAGVELSDQVVQFLNRLGMANVVFDIRFNEFDEARPDGKDDVEFLFSANAGRDLMPLSKVASGGEISRLMLSVKASLASKSELATIIFDEIDTGISGEVADKMGKIILEMGATTQIIAITHLPQIAAKGIRQLKVFKEDESGITVTRIKQLEKNERIEEIARLLSGEGISREAMDNARVLLTAS